MNMLLVYIEISMIDSCSKWSHGIHICNSGCLPRYRYHYPLVLYSRYGFVLILPVLLDGLGKCLSTSQTD